MPGQGHGDWDATYQQLSTESEGPDTGSPRLIETPRFSRTPITRGITDGMDYGSFDNGGAPSVPYPVRSSLAQLVTRWRSQISIYISTVRRGSPEQLDAMGIGHPFVKAYHRTYLSPIQMQQYGVEPKPTLRRQFLTGTGRVARPGGMGVSPRFNKALRQINYAYRPPVYGEER